MWEFKATAWSKSPRQNFIAYFVHSTFTVRSKIWFTPATIDRLTNGKTKNALHKETVILNYIGCDPISHGLRN